MAYRPPYISLRFKKPRPVRVEHSVLVNDLLKEGEITMKIVLICLSVLGLVSCAYYPYRGNYYGNNRYVTMPYYGGYSGYGWNSGYRGYGGGYRSGYRDHDDFVGGYRGGYGGGFGGGDRR